MQDPKNKYEPEVIGKKVKKTGIDIKN